MPNAKIHIFQCDVSDQPQVAALAEKIQSTIGKVVCIIYFFFSRLQKQILILGHLKGYFDQQCGDCDW